MLLEVSKINHKLMVWSTTTQGKIILREFSCSFSSEVLINFHVSLYTQTLFSRFLILHMLKLLWQPQEDCTSHSKVLAVNTNQNEENIPGQNLGSIWHSQDYPNTFPVHIFSYVEGVYFSYCDLQTGFHYFAEINYLHRAGNILIPCQISITNYWFIFSSRDFQVNTNRHTLSVAHRANIFWMLIFIPR